MGAEIRVSFVIMAYVVLGAQSRGSENNDLYFRGTSITSCHQPPGLEPGIWRHEGKRSSSGLPNYQGPFGAVIIVPPLFHAPQVHSLDDNDDDNDYNVTYMFPGGHCATEVLLCLCTPSECEERATVLKHSVCLAHWVLL